jgi:hypothetical protein
MKNTISESIIMTVSTSVLCTTKAKPTPDISLGAQVEFTLPTLSKSFRLLLDRFVIRGTWKVGAECVD